MSPSPSLFYQTINYHEEYADRIPDKYLSQDSVWTDLKGNMEEAIIFAGTRRDIYDYIPYMIEASSVSDEITKIYYRELKGKMDQSLTYEEFKTYLSDDIANRIVFVKNGLPIETFSIKKHGDSTSYSIADATLSFSGGVQAALEKVIHIGPLRKKPERFTDVVKDSYLEVGTEGEYFSSILHHNPEVLNSINVALENLGLNYEIKIHCLVNDDLIAFGDIHSLQVIEKNTGTPLTLCDVGFGLSQVLPILVQVVIPGSKIILIEQPEIHLHPKMQTELADFFIKHSGIDTNQLVIETHSEHLLLRIMRRIRETTSGTIKDSSLALNPEDVSVLYVESIDGQSIVREMPLDENGELIKAWPGGFFEEGLREIF